MPFSRPTLTALRQQAAADIDAGLPAGTALLRFSNLGILGRVLAGMVSGLYGYLDWIAKQCTPFTATGEFLEAWAALKGVTRTPATAASGAATFAATEGTTIPAGTPLARGDGQEYSTTADATAAGNSVTVQFVAVSTGATTNAAIGVPLTMGIGVAGISSTGEVTSAVAGGADIEEDDALRSRMLQAYASPPQGGSRTDYQEWAGAVAGVTRSWVYPSAMGPGSIVLLFMMDDAEAAHAGFPQGSNGCATDEVRDTTATGDQLILANAIFAKQPVTALVYAVAPTPNTIDVEITGISGASATTRAAITTAITVALRSSGVPGGVTNISTIEAAIAAVAGTAGFVLTNITCSAGTVAPGAAGNITSNAGALPVLGAVTYA